MFKKEFQQVWRQYVCVNGSSSDVLPVFLTLHILVGMWQDSAVKKWDFQAAHELPTSSVGVGRFSRSVQMVSQSSLE